jgi:predicted O-linked N-acetylglucosamine transferase (SPINDLY family)
MSVNAEFKRAVAHHQSGRLAEAELLYRSVLLAQPHHPDANHNLGMLAGQMGHPAAGLPFLKNALAVNPANPQYVVSYAEALLLSGQAKNALSTIEKAISRGLASPAAKALKRQAEAAVQNPVENGEEPLRHEVNEMLAMLGADQFKLAQEAGQLLTTRYPNSGFAWKTLGVAIQRQGLNATTECKRAVELLPNDHEAHFNLAVACISAAQIDDAVAAYQSALKLKPDYAEAGSNFLMYLSYSPTVSAPTLFAEHRRIAASFEEPLLNHWPKHTNTRDPLRRLQVGIVSGDLRSHAVANYIEPVLLHLAAHPQLSLHAYYNHAIQDSVTQRLKGYLPNWNSVVGLTDDALSQKIQADGIDILIDLSGHSTLNRLQTFARKPAPVQLTWMGFPGTTGLQAMDYYLSDQFFLPSGQFDDQFTEKIVHLPASAAFQPHQDAPPVNALPAQDNGYVTFGSFNQPAKISRAVVALWSQLLRAMPSARMVLGAMPKEGQRNAILEWFTQEGIDRQRLSVYEMCSMKDYQGLHHQVDICLDTFPYNGGTTTLHALWMGVPTLTLVGGTPAGRTGASILGHVGLHAYMATNADEFVQKGQHLAGDLSALSDLRAQLRGRFAESAMGQPAVVAAGLELALRTMWQRWCDGRAPEAFATE